ARQAIPDTPLLACVMGAIAMFVMANEDGARPASRRARRVLFGCVGSVVVVQALYYASYLHRATIVAPIQHPPLLLPIAMLLALVAQARDGLLLLRLPVLALGGLYVEIRGLPRRDPVVGESRWRYALDVIVASWDRHSPDRYLVRILAWPLAWAQKPSEIWERTQALADRVLQIAPITHMRQIYLLWCYAFVAIAILAKGPPGVAVVGGVVALHSLATWRWPPFEIKRGLILLVAIALPWHVAMYYVDGPRFVDEYWGIHILSRGTVGVDNSPGTFAYYTSQIGHGMWLWAALIPAALAAALRAGTATRAGRVRVTITLWACASFTFFALVQTKFHHYILPAIPALGILVAFFLDDLLARRERLRGVVALVGIGLALLVCRDLVFEPERWIEMFVFLYSRPWPSAEPYAIDVSDAFLALGVASAFAIGLLAWRPRLGVVAVGAVGIATCIWALQGYMPIAAKHWGMREAIQTYYRERTIYGAEVTYFGAGQVADEWRDHDDTYRFDTFVPDALQVGQGMTLAVRTHRADNEFAFESEHVLAGRVSAIGAHSVEITFFPNERHRLDGVIARGLASGERGRPPVRVVDADRLLAWQLYWRGENFWTADEIWGWPKDMKTAFMKVDNLEIRAYLGDRVRAPLGRRYFVITEADRITKFEPLLPTPRAKTSYEVLDATSNKFSLAAFWL
ncbi:MAG: hypothetical protein NT062_19630, partial [Proteobacteria bacterium]|nr:hypothetical protein [Pseudomonadota bacterium]